jgi:hypothetical protein
MYLTSTGGSSPFGLGQPASKRYRPPYDKGGIPIGEGDAQNILTILAGPSPYQAYIAHNMATKGAAPPKKFLRIVTNVGTQVPKPLQHLFTSGGGTRVAGTIDRSMRMIYMIELPGLRDATRLEYALHEGVHLYADPVVPTTSCPRVCVGTFQRTYGTGFGEGATQAIAEAIMDAQGIARYYRDRPYEIFTRPMRKVIEKFSTDVFARAYFFGATAAFTTAMTARWGKDWMQVVGYTNAKQPDKAIAEIDKLEKSFGKRLLQGGPKGDFPTPPRYSNVA